MVQHQHCRKLLEEIFTMYEKQSSENKAMCTHELANITLWFGALLYISEYGSINNQ